MAHTHSHVVTGSTPRRLAIALVLTVAFVVLEAGAGWFANSLALLTDAAHNFSDALALGLSWWALSVSLRPASDSRTYGYHRVGILVALLNATTLLALSLLVAYEALGRLAAPPVVQEQTIIAVAVIGLFLNGGIAWSLHTASKNDVNVRATFIHMAGDAVSTVGVILAGIGIALFGWQWLDPAASILIAVLILWSSWGIVRETVDILLEATPRDIDMSAVVRDVLSISGVRGVHDLHVWSITSSLRALSMHLLTDDILIADGAQIQRNVNEVLMRRYAIAHATLQLECVDCEPDVLYCALNEPHGPAQTADVDNAASFSQMPRHL
jgi:cobalt-zinc-cadmium efflux system protein